MLRRVALVLLLLFVSGVAAIFAAGHLGINLPWDIAVTDPEPASKNREEAPTAEAPKTAERTPEQTLDDTAAALGAAPEAPAPGSGKVEIDISRIAPDGTSVFAGRAEPDSYVTVLEDGKPAGTAKADAYGEWSLSTEHKFASADPKLSYQVSRTPPPAPEPPKQEVAKAEPAPPSAASVAGEVMRKFENLVEEAREEAKRNEPKEEAQPKQESAPTIAEERPAAQPDTHEKQEQESVAAAPLPAEPSTNPSTNDATTSGTETHGSTAAPPAPTVAQEGPSAGVKSDAIPVPLMFVYNEATLTPEGERAAALLLEYLTLKRLSAVELTGHADERGSDAYNYELSRERLETVAKILKDGGYTGELTLTPKGKSEPYMGVDRTAYKGEALYQLDRRVELRLTR